MKKSTTFLLLVAFLISIFVISTIGVAAHNSHMKVYFQKAEITDCKTLKVAGGVRKYDRVVFDPDGETIYQIQYKLTPNPEEVTERDGFEFIFDNDGGTHKDSHGDDQPNATLNKNIVTFLAETTVVVRLQTLDGSNQFDTITIICKALVAS